MLPRTFTTLRKLIVSSILPLLFCSPPIAAHARPVQFDDLPVIGEFDRGHVVVNREGQTKIKREVQFKILNEQGRESESVQRIPFNARAVDLKLVKAIVINDGKETIVSSKQIEIKESAESDKAFDSMKQMIISFPNVQVGSQIFLSYEMNFHEVAMPGFWSQTSVFDSVHMQEMQVKIVSELKLYKWIQDPEGYLDFKESVDGKGRTVFEYKLKRPLMQGLVQEEKPYRHPSRSLVVSLSSLANWNQFAQGITAAHELLLGEKLPANLQKIKDEVMQNANFTELEKLNAVTAKLSEQFRYFGDWRRRKGGLLPRSIGEIAESRYGDCKDLSLVVAAIYRAMGFKADLAWILRGEQPQEKSWYVLPTEALFNHAIVRVVGAAGGGVSADKNPKTYWIDPTNPTSFAQGIPGDLLNRPAFVLDAKGGFLDATPSDPSLGNTYFVKQIMRVVSPQKLEVNADLGWTGRWAVGVTGRLFFGSLENVKYEVVKSLAGSDELLSYEFLSVPQKDRVVQNTKMKLKYVLGGVGLKTSAGIGFPLLRNETVNDLIVSLRDRKSDLLLDHPGVESLENDLLGVQKVGNTNLNCDIKSPWVHLTRRVSAIPEGVRVSDRFEIFSDHILNEQLQSAEFATFQSQVRDCFFRSAVIFKPVANLPAKPRAKMKSTN